MCKGRILVIDDLPDVRETLSGLLLDEGYDVCSVSSRAEALQKLDTEHFHIAVVDVRLDEEDEDNQDGILLMHEIKERDPSTAVIILTGYANVKIVREALEPNLEGVSPAFGFLEKSEIEKLPEYVERAFEHATSESVPAVDRLIAQGENDHVEFKSSIRWDFDNNSANKHLREPIGTAIAGMLNGEGGTLLIGVADDGTVLGIEKDLQTLRKPDTDGFELALTDVVKTYLGLEYMACIQTRFEQVDEKQICVVSIEKSPAPVFLALGGSHKFCVRMGNSTRSLDVRATMSYIQTHWKEGK
jgi:CheY-like chemotaxis protein